MRLMRTVQLFNQMKKYIVTSLAAIVLATGCMTPSNNTEAGAARGAVVGGILGAVIGNNTKGKNTAEGAAIGALGGALLGGALGNAKDKKTGDK
jgi:uncharacterized protein YcfJ